MRISVYDHCGHPFQVELSRELASRGHEVTHSYCAAYVSGKGELEAGDTDRLVVEPIGVGVVAEKKRFARRLVQELRWGVALTRQVRRTKPDVALLANAQVPTLLVFVLAAALLRIPWVLWHQDVHAVALRAFAGDRLPRGFGLVARAVGWGERFASRRAAAIVVIAESFVPVHEAWGTAHKTTVIANWAPLDEIVPVDRKNEWTVDQQLDDTQTLLYSGTLGLKHNPALLVSLADRIRRRGTEVRLVVVNEGEAVDVIRAEADRLAVPVTILPFQPYARLSEVLGSGDILVVLLEEQAGAFSVPSKTLSYLCAGRPVLGFVPPDNSAAQLVVEAGGHVVAPQERSVDDAARWAERVLHDADLREEIGQRARALAEREFALPGCADRFEAILHGCARVSHGANDHDVSTAGAMSKDVVR